MVMIFVSLDSSRPPDEFSAKKLGFGGSLIRRLNDFGAIILYSYRRVQIKRANPRRAMQNVRERCRRGQFERVTEHKRATTRTNKHSQILSA
jgi:hypothetical protein